MPEQSITITNVNKSFVSKKHFWQKGKTTPALSNVSLRIGAGKCLALLGPNGAGKTTLLKIISTLIIPEQGTVTVKGYSLGKDDDKIKSLIGFATTEERSFYWRLTGRQNLEIFSTLYGLDQKTAKQRLNALFRRFGVDYADKRFDAYSTGMKRKFVFIRALLHDPEFLLFDEPTKSLDYESAQILGQCIKEETRRGKTVLLATHNLEEAQQLCDAYAILHQGRLAGCGTLEELRKQTDSPSDPLQSIYLKQTKSSAS